VPKIIFPLREKLSMLFAQQRPRWTGGRKIVTLPVMPWDDFDRPPVIGYGVVDKPPIAAANVWTGYGLCATGARAVPMSSQRQPAYLASFSEQRFEPAVVHALKPMPATFFTISGVTRDSTGAVLPGCAVDLFVTDTDANVGSAVSNADGNYYAKGAVRGKTHYVVAYKAGSPDVAGTTVNTLTVP
jgi:hypothetical protein